MTRRLSLRMRRLLRSLITLFVYDVFISYARRDGRRYAHAIQRSLETSGLVTYLDTGDMVVGDRLDRALARALGKSRLLVLVATSGAQRSAHVGREIETFLETGRPIVPLDFSGSYVTGEWPALSTLGLVWINETAEALTAGAPSREVVAGIRRHLKSSGSRAVVKRLIAGTVVAVTALAVGVVWSSALAAKQGRQRDAQQLTARGQLAFDSDRNPLRALALGVAALRQHDLVEASDMVAGVLPYARRPRGAAKVGAFAALPLFSARGRYLAVRSQAGDRDAKRQRLTVLGVPALTEMMRVERPEIAAAAISPDERAVAVADGGPCLSLLSIDGGEVTCVAHAGVHLIRFSGDGRYMSTVGRLTPFPPHTSTVKVWATDGWREVAHLNVPSMIRGTTFSPDGRQLMVATSGRGAICIWDFAAGNCQVFQYPQDSTLLGFGREEDSSDLVFSRDGQPMVATSHAGAAVTMLRQDGKRFDIEDFSGAPTMDPSSTAMLTRHSGGAVTLFSVPRSQHGEIIGRLVHSDRVRDARFTADGRSIVTTSDDGVVRIWDAGVKLAEHNDFGGSDRFAAMVTHGTKSIPWHRGPAESVDIDLAPDGQTFAAVSPDGWVRLWSITPEPWVDRGRHGQWIGGIAAVPSTDTFITASDYYGRVWQLNPLRATRSLRRHANDISGVFVSRDGKLVATVGSDGAVVLFKGGSYEPLRAIRHSAEGRTIKGALSANGTTVVTGGLDGMVRVWDAATGTPKVELSSQKRLDGLAVGPSGDVVAIGEGNLATIWDAAAPARRRLTFECPGAITVLRFDRSGSRLVCGTESGEVSLHDARSGRNLGAFQHVARVSSAAYSEDDRYLATGGHDRTVRVWDTRTGAEVARLTRSFRVDAVDFVGDGRLVAAGGQNLVQLSPWRSADLAALACDLIRPLRGESWARLVGRSVDEQICSPQ